MYIGIRYMLYICWKKLSTQNAYVRIFEEPTNQLNRVNMASFCFEYLQAFIFYIKHFIVAPIFIYQICSSICLNIVYM